MNAPESSARLTTALSSRYTIERELGAGGMATVYLAHDVKHDRNVAVKVLRPELAAVLGAERFVQEIKTTASLQHPHILPLHDSGEADGFLYYVMPYVEGETLRDKLNREKQLGIEEAVKITTEVADALDYAHRHNVIHRDIKPENILLHDGRPMVADFGIALAVSAAAGGRMTETGLSLGTPHYMSPEQATAEKDLTNRSDIYSLGAVLYEMLTGDPPHVGSSAQQIIMKIVTEDVQPVAELRKTVPPNVAAAVAQALEKLPADRFGGAAQFSEALNNPAFAVSSAAPFVRGSGLEDSAVESTTSRARWGIGLSVALAVGIATGVLLAPRTTVTTRGYDIGLPDSAPMAFGKGSPWGEGWTVFAVSPQEDYLVYVADRDTTTELWYRSLTDFDARPLPGTEGAYQLFLSPDGEWVAFLSGNQLKKSRIDRAGVTIVAELSRPFGGDWALAGTVAIIDGGLNLIDVHTGARDRVTLPEGCAQPHVLPDGESVLCSHGQSNRVFATDVEGRSHQALTLPLGPSVEDAAGAFIATDLRAVDGQYLLYISEDGQLHAASFNTENNVIGRPVSMEQSPKIEAMSGAGQFQVGKSGSLYFVPGEDARLGRLVKAGGVRPTEYLDIHPARIHQFDISADGSRMVVVQEGVGGRELWFYDLVTGRSQRWLMAWNILEPRWTPDGERVVFGFRTSADEPRVTLVGSPTSPVSPDTLLRSSFDLSQITSDGLLVGSVWSPSAASDIAIVDIAAEPVRVDTLQLPGTQMRAAISPDSRWIVYLSTESGRDEVFLEPFPGRGSRYRIAAGLDPLWLDATTFVYRTGTSWYRVRISGSGTYPYDEPELWFEDPLFIDTWLRSQAIHPDGSIVYVRGSGRRTASFVRVIPNWVEQVKLAVDEANR